jgi:hypothetical protein
MNAYGRARRVRHDVHDHGFLGWQCEHARENEHVCVHGCERSQNRDHAGGYVDVGVRVSLSLFLHAYG